MSLWFFFFYHTNVLVGSVACLEDVLVLAQFLYFCNTGAGSVARVKLVATVRHAVFRVQPGRSYAFFAGGDVESQLLFLPGPPVSQALELFLRAFQRLSSLLLASNRGPTSIVQRPFARSVQGGSGRRRRRIGRGSTSLRTEERQLACKEPLALHDVQFFLQTRPEDRLPNSEIYAGGTKKPPFAQSLGLFRSFALPCTHFSACGSYQPLNLILSVVSAVPLILRLGEPGPGRKQTFLVQGFFLSRSRGR